MLNYSNEHKNTGATGKLDLAVPYYTIHKHKVWITKVIYQYIHTYTYNT